MSGVISSDALRALVAGWIEAGRNVIGPARVGPARFAIRPLRSAAELYLEGWAPTVNSIKEAVFPRRENLYSYRLAKEGIELIDAPGPAAETIVIGAHPCQAAALPILDKVFNWDFEDEFYNRRRAATTVVSLACSSFDDQCFCTSVGLGAASEKGSDAMLYETASGEFAVRVLTPKGRALFGDGYEAEAAQTAAGPPVRFDAARTREFARDQFAAPFWKERALACVGCGICAYVCPACHCFDIVDEKRGAEGVRARNWDACQFPMFTLHASGHNPRQSQGDRQRQRIYHKFFVYPDKFGEILCTGCGACARGCPEGLGVLPVVTEIPDDEPVQA
jgi:ferredoxin